MSRPLRIHVQRIMMLFPVGFFTLLLGILVYSIQNPKLPRTSPASVSIPGQSFVSGYIRDADLSLPVVGAKITANGSFATSNKDGAFVIPSESGEVELLVQKEGYRKQKKTIKIEVDSTVQSEFALERVP